MRQRRVRDRVAIFREKNIPRNTEYSAEDKNARNSVPNHSVTEEHSELRNFVLYILRKINAQNFVPNHFTEEKNTLKPEFRSELLSEIKHF
jgi:hypothetical protein